MRIEAFVGDSVNLKYCYYDYWTDFFGCVCAACRLHGTVGDGDLQWSGGLAESF